MVLEKMAKTREEKRIDKGIYLKDGSYHIDYYVKGRRRREMIGTSLKLARTVRNKRLIQIAEGKFLDIDKINRIKLGDFVKQFLETYSKPNKATWKDDNCRLNGAAGFFGSGTYLDEITPKNIEQFKNYKLQGGTKAATINRYLTVLQTMYKIAIEWGHAKENPLLKVKHLREDNVVLRFLEEEEIARLLEASSDYLKPIIVTALNTGMRRMEIFNLKWSDVDFRRGLVSMHKTKNNDIKVIPMNTLLRHTLARVREHSISEYVFPIKSIRKDFSNALKCARISDCRFHTLRHTFASHLVMQGVDLVTVKELMGHKSIKMTMRYSHLSQDHKSKAVEALEGVMDNVWATEEKAQEIEKALNAVTAYK